MTERRSYQQFCGLAKALDRVGERWTLLIVRNLLLGPRRYGQLLKDLPGVTTNLLAKRLKELEQIGILEHLPTAGAARSEAYALTDAGVALEPVIMELGRWGGRFLATPEQGDVFDIAWGLISLKRRYRGGLSTSVEFAIDARRFELTFSPTYLAIQERPAVLAAATLAGSTSAFRSLFWLGDALSELTRRGALSVHGDQAALARVLQAFDGVRLGSDGEPNAKASAKQAPKARAGSSRRAAPRSRAKTGAKTRATKA